MLAINQQWSLSSTSLPIFGLAGSKGRSQALPRWPQWSSSLWAPETCGWRHGGSIHLYSQSVLMSLNSEVSTIFSPKSGHSWDTDCKKETEHWRWNHRWMIHQHFTDTQHTPGGVRTETHWMCHVCMAAVECLGFHFGVHVNRLEWTHCLRETHVRHTSLTSQLCGIIWRFTLSPIFHTWCSTCSNDRQRKDLLMS